MAKGLALEWSHGKPRAIVRVDETTPIDAAASEPTQDPTTGRFLPGNRMHRRRQLVKRAKGIATLNPATAPTWLRPHIEQGAPYVSDLLRMLEGRPELHPLAGDVADAHVMYLGMRTLALQTDDKRERAQLLTESRAWLREHRSCLATLAALAGDVKLPEPNPHAAIAAAMAEEEANRDG
jgi:hypothetical protein